MKESPHYEEKLSSVSSGYLSSLVGFTMLVGAVFSTNKASGQEIYVDTSGAESAGKVVNTDSLRALDFMKCVNQSEIILFKTLLDNKEKKNSLEGFAFQDYLPGEKSTKFIMFEDSADQLMLEVFGSGIQDLGIVAKFDSATNNNSDFYAENDQVLYRGLNDQTIGVSASISYLKKLDLILISILQPEEFWDKDFDPYDPSLAEWQKLGNEKKKTYVFDKKGNLLFKRIGTGADAEVTLLTGGIEATEVNTRLELARGYYFRFKNGESTLNCEEVLELKMAARGTVGEANTFSTVDQKGEVLKKLEFIKQRAVYKH